MGFFSSLFSKPKPQSEIQYYRQTDYGDQYAIRYQKESNGTFRIFCHQAPRNNYSKSVGTCHLYSSGEICVDRGKFTPKTMDQAKAIATAFMDGYSLYVRTGSFPNGPKRVQT